MVPVRSPFDASRVPPVIVAVVAILLAVPPAVADPTVDGIDPSTVSTADATPVAVAGADFTADSRLALALGGPAPLASFDVGGPIGRVRVRDGRLVVAAGAAGLVSIDVTDPAHPGTPTARPLPGPAFDVALDGDTAWVAAGEAGVLALPAAARLRASVFAAVDVVADRILLAGDRVYVAAGARMTVIDRSDPASPTVAGELVFPVSPYDGVSVRDMMLVDGRLYVALTRYRRPGPGIPAETGALAVVDVDTASAPALVETLPLVGNAVGVARAGDRLYVAGEGGGVGIVDVSDPDAPAPVPFEAPAGGAWSVAVDGTSLVVAMGGAGAQVFDLGAGDPPHLRSWRDDPSSSGRPIRVSLAVADRHAFVGTDSRIDVLGELDARTPVARRGWRYLGGIRRVALRDGVAFGANPFLGAIVIDGALVSTDVSDPEVPELLDGTFVNGPNGAWDLVLAGDYAYVAAADAVAVVSIADPSDLAVVRQVPFPGFAQGIDAAGDVLYVAGAGVGLRTYDLSTPEDPRELGTAPLPGSSYAVAVGGGVAWVAGGADGLHGVDVSDPTAPFPVATLPLPGFATDVALADGIAFVAGGAEGVHVVDVSQPDSPVAIGLLDVPRADGLAVADGRLLVGGLTPAIAYEFDVRRPSSPIPVAAHRTFRQVEGFAIDGASAAVADLGISMLELGPYPTDVAVESDARLSATVPSGLIEGDYDVVVVDADGASGRRSNGLAACAPLEFDAAFRTMPRGTFVVVSGDPALFEPVARHEAVLRLPASPVDVVVEIAPGPADEATLRVAGSPPRATLVGPDAARLLSTWRTILEAGGIPLERAGTRRYGPLDIEVAGADAALADPVDALPLSGPALRDGVPSLVARLHDGRLVSARIRGPRAEAEIVVRAEPDGGCAPDLVLRWPENRLTFGVMERSGPLPTAR